MPPRQKCRVHSCLPSDAMCRVGTFANRDRLEAVKTRKRNPIKPRTVSSFESHLKYINQNLGVIPLSDVNKRHGEGVHCYDGRGSQERSAAVLAEVDGPSCDRGPVSTDVLGRRGRDDRLEG